jgi:hypothetical protein
VTSKELIAAVSISLRFEHVLNRRAVICVILLGLIDSSSRAAAPDYLSQEFVPTDEASELPTPFTPLPEEEPTVGLFSSSTEPFFRDLNFSLQPRLYFRSLDNSTGTNNTFAGGRFAGLHDRLVARHAPTEGHRLYDD